MIVDICQQSLAGLCHCQLDVAPILWQIAPVKKSRLDESSADPAGRRQMDVESMRYAGCVQRARLGCQNQDAQLRQGHPFADSCNGLGRNGAEDACRTLNCSKYCAADSPRRTVLRSSSLARPLHGESTRSHSKKNLGCLLPDFAIVDCGDSIHLAPVEPTVRRDWRNGQISVEFASRP